MSEQLREVAKVAKAWPYEEARKLLKRYPNGPGDAAIVFETGYGPSGLPHSVLPGSRAHLDGSPCPREMADWPSRLVSFSDDMDGMRKVPPNVPHQDMMHQHIGQPLCGSPILSAAAMPAMRIKQPPSASVSRRFGLTMSSWPPAMLRIGPVR